MSEMTYFVVIFQGRISKPYQEIYLSNLNEIIELIKSVAENNSNCLLRELREQKLFFHIMSKFKAGSSYTNSNLYRKENVKITHLKVNGKSYCKY